MFLIQLFLIDIYFNLYNYANFIYTNITLLLLTSFFYGEWMQTG